MTLTEAEEHEERANGESEWLAAVDLGSNSFHLTIARIDQGQPRVLDRLRDRVALASGLDRDHRLSEEACGRALETLFRFGQRLREIPPGRLRAVGTYTLRRAKDTAQFLARAEQALGHPIEILSGAEEARLVYLGVAHNLPRHEGGRLVVDIGGGSTECILGQGFEARQTDSLSMGCVSYSRRYFPRGIVTAKAYDKAVLAARLELEPLKSGYRQAGWEQCAGSSGTILAIDGILRALHAADAALGPGRSAAYPGVTLKGIKRLAKLLLAARSMSALDLPGLAADRRDVLPGGLAILQAVFRALRIASMEVSEGALRDGVLYDLLGRIQHEDVRERTVESLCTRYHIDRAQAERVESTALKLFDAVAGAWGLGAVSRLELSWAARLHEIGLAVAYPGFHKHGAYLVTHGVMRGFSREEQDLLAALIRTHRRKISWGLLRSVRGRAPREVRALSVLLRLAARLNRSRADAPLPTLAVRARTDRLELGLPGEWLAEHPLTRADLEDEAGLLARVDFELRLNGDG